jgi:hypothetical protein
VSLDDLIQLFMQVAGGGTPASGAPSAGPMQGGSPATKSKGGKASVEAKVDELASKFDLLLNALGMQPGMVPAAPPAQAGAQLAPESMGQGMDNQGMPPPPQVLVPPPGMEGATPAAEPNPLAPAPGMVQSAEEQPKLSKPKKEVPPAPEAGPLAAEEPASPELKARTPAGQPVEKNEPKKKEAAERVLSLHRIIQNLTAEPGRAR